MWKRIKDWFVSRESPIKQGLCIAVVVLLICFCIVFCTVSCSSFSGDSASPQFGLSNTAINVKGLENA